MMEYCVWKILGNKRETWGERERERERREWIKSDKQEKHEEERNALTIRVLKMLDCDSE